MAHERPGSVGRDVPCGRDGVCGDGRCGRTGEAFDGGDAGERVCFELLHPEDADPVGGDGAQPAAQVERILAHEQQPLDVRLVPERWPPRVRSAAVSASRLQDAAEHIVERALAPREIHLRLAHVVRRDGARSGHAQHQQQLRRRHRAHHDRWPRLVEVCGRLLEEDLAAGLQRLARRQRAPPPEEAGVAQPQRAALACALARRLALHRVEVVRLSAVGDHARVRRQPRLQLAGARLLHADVDYGGQAGEHTTGRLEAVTRVGASAAGRIRRQDATDGESGCIVRHWRLDVYKDHVDTTHNALQVLQVQGHSFDSRLFLVPAVHVPVPCAVCPRSPFLF
eukprot:3012871-Prymnesium_polylepis.1